MEITDRQIDKIAKTLGLTRDGGEEQDLWESRVMEAIDETWETLGEHVRAAAELRHRLWIANKIMVSALTPKD